MGKDQLLAEILRLPPEERHDLIHEALESLPDKFAIDPSMTPELRAELERRHADMLANPDDEVSWEEASAELDRRAEARRKSAPK